FCQIQYNILDENNQAGKDGLKYAADKGLGVIVMEPLRGGNLAATMPYEAAAIYKSAAVHRTNVEWALRWIWNHPEVICVLSGMNEMNHIKENLEIADKALPDSLTKDELEIVKRVGNSYREAMKVNCTGCQYCMPCPFGVNISGCFEHFNSYHMFGRKFMTKAFYHVQLAGIVNEAKSLASLCTACGKCISHCPQDINIPEEMINV
ncbi:MAG: aldo/keto reductase, partial [bacterium]|nr:aldo/keto reductase [bacterium]